MGIIYLQMWYDVNSFTLHDGQSYSVRDNQRFVHKAIFKDGKLINKVTKEVIVNIIAVWKS